MAKFRWAYVGSGNIANSTAKQIVKGNHSITCVYSRNAEKANLFANKYGAKAFNSYNEMLENGDFDAVYIATPHTAHVDYAVLAMQKGKPVLCEKPVGVSITDVETLVNSSRQNNVYFAEAMWTWFSDVALKVKEWVNSGKIGDVKSVVINYAFPGVLMPKTSRVLMPETAGGALLDIGIYPITYCYNIFGYPNEIKCKGKIKNGIDISETVILKYDGFECELNMSLCKLKENAVIKGTKGTVSLPAFFHMANKAILKGENNEVFNGKTDYLVEFTRVADEINAGLKESKYIPFSSTIATMKIMDECRKQMGLKYPFEI